MPREPLAHFYAAPEVDRPEHDHDRFPAGRCARPDCARPESDPVHLTPGDDDAINAAIRAASPHPEPQRTPEQDERATARARKRNAARYAFGAGARDSSPSG